MASCLVPFGHSSCTGRNTTLSIVFQQPCIQPIVFSGCTVADHLRDSHSKTLYRALSCFLYDFWDQKECEASTDAAAVQQLYNLPLQPGASKCFHLFDGGRVCVVYAVIGTSLANNNEVRSKAGPVLGSAV